MAGLTDKEIAHSLQLSLHTIRTYWIRIREKLQMTTRAEVITWAARLDADDESDNTSTSRLIEADLKRFEFEQILGKAPLMIFASGTQSQLHYVNEHFLEYTGLTLENALPYPWPAIVPPGLFERKRDQSLDAQSRKQSFEIEVPILGRDGAYRWHLVRVIPILDDNENPIKWVGTATNIDDIFRRTNGSILEGGRFRIIADASQAEISFSDPRAEIRYTNPAYDRLTGGHPEDVSWTAVIHPDDRYEVEEKWDIARKEGQVLRSRHRYLHPDGSTADAQLCIKSIDGDGWVITTENLTLVQDEAALQMQLVKLSDLLLEILKKDK